MNSNVTIEMIDEKRAQVNALSAEARQKMDAIERDNDLSEGEYRIVEETVFAPVQEVMVEQLFLQAQYSIGQKAWDSARNFILSDPRSMQLAFKNKLYEDFPRGMAYDLILDAYLWQGCSKAPVRAALRKIRKYGEPQLPPELGDEIVIYRACVRSKDTVMKSMSWTTDPDVVIWFRRVKWEFLHKPVHIYEGRIHREDVLAYTNKVLQSEVIQYGKVYNVREIYLDDKPNSPRINKMVNLMRQLTYLGITNIGKAV